MNKFWVAFLLLGLLDARADSIAYNFEGGGPLPHPVSQHPCNGGEGMAWEHGVDGEIGDTLAIVAANPPHRCGGKALRLRLDADLKQYRSEVAAITPLQCGRGTGPDQNEMTYRYSVLLPVGFVPETDGKSQPEIIGQWKIDGAVLDGVTYFWTHNLALQLEGTSLILIASHTDDLKALKYQGERSLNHHRYFLGKLAIGQWTDLEFFVRWSDNAMNKDGHLVNPGASGLIRVAMDGRPVGMTDILDTLARPFVELAGPNTYPSAFDRYGRFKVGLYKWVWKTGTNGLQRIGNARKREIFIDNYEILDGDHFGEPWLSCGQEMPL